MAAGTKITLTMEELEAKIAEAVASSQKAEPVSGFKAVWKTAKGAAVGAKIATAKIMNLAVEVREYAKPDTQGNLIPTRPVIGFWQDVVIKSTSGKVLDTRKEWVSVGWAAIDILKGSTEPKVRTV